LNAARALLQEEEDMQAVHSAKSVAALLKTAKDKIAQIKTSVHPGIAAEPKITNEVCEFVKLIISVRCLTVLYLYFCSPLLSHMTPAKVLVWKIRMPSVSCHI
jgi:hypothetical protein